MSIKNCSGVLRIIFFGSAKLLSSGGNTFFLSKSGLDYFDIENTYSDSVAGFLALAMVYVTGFTQMPALYKGKTLKEKKLSWTWFNYLCFVSGVLQGTCVGLNAYLGSDTIFNTLKIKSNLEVKLTNSLLAVSNFIAYHYFVVPKVVKNGFAVQTALSKRTKYCNWSMDGVDKTALTKSLLFGGLGVFGYSFLSYFNTSSAASVVPGLNKLGDAGQVAFGVLSAYATMFTFSLSRLPGSYELQKTKPKEMVIDKPCLNLSHRFFGTLDLISFAFIVWSSSAQTFADISDRRVPILGLLFLGLPSASAVYLHFSFAIQILFNQARTEKQEELPSFAEDHEGGVNVYATTKLLPD